MKLKIALSICVAGLLAPFGVSGEFESEMIESSSFRAHLPVLYKGEAGAFINEVALTGMIQYQVVQVDSDFDSIEESEFRRFRFGGDLKFADHFSVVGKISLDPEEAAPLYDGLTEFAIRWSPFGNDKKAFKKFHVAGGKLKPKFTREYSTSAKTIRTVERSLLVNQLAPSRSTGVWIEGKYEKWRYVISGFSGDDANEFSHFDNDGFVGLAKLEYELGEEFVVGLDFMTGSSEQGITAPIQYATSLSTEWNAGYDVGRASLVTDLIYSDGEDSAIDGDTWGLVFMPAFQLTDKLEFVARYQMASSSADTGLRLQRRYERSATAGRAQQDGDFYQAGYVGVNYYLKDHKLKIMTGVEYSHLDGAVDDFSGWSLFTGLRLYF